MNDYNKEMDKTIVEIFSGRYVIPLYQRNFAWRTDEIQQLLQDVYDAYKVYKQENAGNYYIGSLVVIKRHNGDYEVIDGQQRLTVLSLIASFFSGDDKLSHTVLFYDSRPDVQEFFELLCGGNSDAAMALTAPTLFYLKEAYEFLQNAKVKNGSVEEAFYEVKGVADFFLNHVVLVRNEMPEDTDVAAYFEIMNNRGEQLQKHEIVKARMLGRIKDADGANGYDIDKQHLFAKIWDACSQMDVPIQRLFGADDRRKIFGDGYADFPYNITSISSSAMANKESYCLSEVLEGRGSVVDGNELNEEVSTETDDNTYASIIDFPNFLMHVLKLYLCEELQVDSESIPLNEKDLLSAYQQQLSNIDPMSFGKMLLFCRTVFDRFIVKNIDDAKDSEDGQKWVLLKPTNYGDTWKYTSSFVDAQENGSVVKAISMLQVTFRQRIYKNWLYAILKWLHGKCFKNGDLSSVRADEYMKFLHEYMLDYYETIEDKDRIAFVPDDVTPTPENSYSRGTNTPHFLFNFIDYLYWCDWHVNPNKYNRFNLRDFAFKYWNSVEHHRARNKAEDCHCIHNLGNLCLVSKVSNSRLSDRIVKEKVEEYGKGNLGINRQIIYAETIESNWDWGDEQIHTHYNEIAMLLNDRQKILSAACLFAKLEGRSVDMADNIDELGVFIEQHFFNDIVTGRCFITVVRKNDEKWACHDEEEPQKWCGRYFMIACGSKEIKAFVGWFYGGGSGGKYTRAPRFVVQVNKDSVSELAALNSPEWHEEGEEWLNKDLSGDLHDVKSVAIEFKREMESLCARI